MHWVPSYVRSELKKKTGIVVNEYGVKVDEVDDSNGNKMITDSYNPNDYIINLKTDEQNVGAKGKPKKDYTPIQSYKPSGNLIYNDELLNKLGNKFNFK